MDALKMAGKITWVPPEYSPCNKYIRTYIVSCCSITTGTIDNEA